MQIAKMSNPKTTKASVQAGFRDDALNEYRVMNTDVSTINEQANNFRIDELCRYFQFIKQPRRPTSGSAVPSLHFLRGMIRLFSGPDVRLGINCLVGGPGDSHIVLSGHASEVGLAGLRRVRVSWDTPLRWKQLATGQLYALDNLSQLVELLAVAEACE